MKVSGEPPGTVLLGSLNKRCYLFLCQSAERMATERANARQHGIQDPVDFVLEFDGVRYELSYEQLRDALLKRERSMKAIDNLQSECERSPFLRDEFQRVLREEGCPQAVTSHVYWKLFLAGVAAERAQRRSGNPQ